MNFVTLIAFASGLVVGGIFCAALCSQERRRTTRETAEQMKRSGEIQDSLYASVLGSLRGVLARLESADFAGAKAEVAGLLAILYQTKTEGRRSCPMPPPNPAAILTA